MIKLGRSPQANDALATYAREVLPTIGSVLQVNRGHFEVPRVSWNPRVCECIHVHTYAGGRIRHPPGANGDNVQGRNHEDVCGHIRRPMPVGSEGFRRSRFLVCTCQTKSGTWRRNAGLTTTLAPCERVEWNSHFVIGSIILEGRSKQVVCLVCDLHCDAREFQTKN